MVEPLRHRQTKGAATDMFYLMPPRHISTLHETDLTHLTGVLRGNAELSVSIRIPSWTHNGLWPPARETTRVRALCGPQHSRARQYRLPSSLFMYRPISPAEIEHAICFGHRDVAWVAPPRTP